MQTPYTPISCSFHDQLLAHATTGKVVAIVYLKDGLETHCDSKILDVFTKEKAEFMLLQNEELIRLDQIVSVDGLILHHPKKEN